MGLFYASPASDGAQPRPYTTFAVVGMREHVEQEEGAYANEDNQSHLDSRFFVDLGDKVRRCDVDCHTRG